MNISSISGLNPAQRHSHYNTSKAGVEMFTQAIAAELGRFSIRVNSVAPGLIANDAIHETGPDGVERWRSKVPLDRVGTADDVAKACVFLASPAADWITGASLRVDGGMMPIGQVLAIFRGNGHLRVDPTKM